MAPVVHPEDEADNDGKREVEKVEDHPHPIPDRDPSGIVEPVLEAERRQASGEEGPLQARDVVNGKSRLAGEAAHDLVAEEEDEEGQPVGEKRASAAQRNGD